MDIIIKGSDAILAGEFIEPDIVFDCGQCFRFTKREDIWTGVAHGRVLNVQKTEEGLRLIGGAADAESIWRGYFDADTSYADILTEISADDTVRSAAADFKGMRLLRQQPFETLISFIISANNNIKRISKIIEAVCALAGEEIAEGKYAFPAPEALAALSEEQLTACGAGYRAPYIKKTATAGSYSDFLFTTQLCHSILKVTLKVALLSSVKRLSHSSKQQQVLNSDC